MLLIKFNGIYRLSSPFKLLIIPKCCYSTKLIWNCVEQCIQFFCRQFNFIQLFHFTCNYLLFVQILYLSSLSNWGKSLFHNMNKGCHMFMLLLFNIIRDNRQALDTNLSQFFWGYSWSNFRLWSAIMVTHLDILAKYFDIIL